MQTTSSQMPMGQAAKLPLSAADLMPPIARGAAPGAPPPPAAAGLMAGPGGTPMGASGFPAPNAPASPPFEVVLQPDGSSIYRSLTDPPIVLGVNKPPKVPPALMAAKQGV